MEDFADMHIAYASQSHIGDSFRLAVELPAAGHCAVAFVSVLKKVVHLRCRDLARCAVSRRSVPVFASPFCHFLQEPPDDDVAA